MAKVFMSETRKTLFVFAFVLRIYFSLGSSLMLSDLSHALLNQPFTFTCTATEADNLVDRIKFFKEGEANPVGALSQTTTGCALFSNSEGYVASCGSHSNSDSTKYYTLTISNTTDRDAANWWCEFNSDGTRSNLVNLQIIGTSTASTTVTTSGTSTTSITSTSTTATNTTTALKLPCPWCIGVTVTLAIFICVGIIVAVVLKVIWNNKSDSTKKIVAIFLLVVGIIVIILAVTEVGLLASDTNIDRDSKWTAAVAITVIGFLSGPVYCIIAGVAIKKIMENVSGPERNQVGNHTVSSSESSPRELHTTLKPRALPPLDAKYLSEDRPEKKKKRRKKTNQTD